MKFTIDNHWEKEIFGAQTTQWYFCRQCRGFEDPRNVESISSGEIAIAARWNTLKVGELTFQADWNVLQMHGVGFEKLSIHFVWTDRNLSSLIFTSYALHMKKSQSKRLGISTECTFHDPRIRTTSGLIRPQHGSFIRRHDNVIMPLGVWAIIWQ